MKNTIKALSKQFFGAKYESTRKSLLAAAILFIAIYAAEIRVAVAPAILYLTSTLFTAGVMWQVLTGRRQMEAMQGMLMLPLDHRGFVFGYVLVLGAHTLVTKTLLVWALFFAAASWRIGEIALAVLCGCMACVVTAAGVPERSCCAAAPLGRRYPGRYFALVPVGGGPFCGGGKRDCRGAVSGFCGCL